jgi:hypothetical protein
MEDRVGFSEDRDGELKGPRMIRIPTMASTLTVQKCITRARAEALPSLRNLLIWTGMPGGETAP